MKKLIFIILFALVLISCKRKNEYDNNEIKDSKRTHIIESGFYNNIGIVEVDGHEYIYNYHGGIVHLESCPCKNK